MNNKVAVPEEGNWVFDRYYDPRAAFAGDRRGDEADGGFDVADMLRTFSHWRWLILGAVSVGIMAGILASLLTTPVYRSWVTLEVNPPVVEIIDENTPRQGGGTNSWDFIATQVGLLRSRSIAERAAQDLNLASNPEFAGTTGDAATRLKIATGRVASGLNVVPPKEGQLIRFSYDDISPQMSARIANQIAESYINSNIQRRYDASSYARNFLKQQIAKTRADLERTERQLVAYAQAQGIISTGSGANGQSSGDVGSLQGSSLVALNQALSEATARRIAAEGAYRQARVATSESTASTAPLRQQRATLEAEFQQKRTFLKPEHPEMLSLRSQINEIDRQISRENSQVSGARSNTLMADYRAAASAERALASRVAALKGSVLDLRGRSIQYTILQRDVDTNRGLYDALLQRYKEVGVSGGVGNAAVSIVDRAEVPGGPFKPNIPLNLLIGLGLGLIGGLTAAIVLEYLNDTIKTREDVRNKLSLACLGAVPKTASKNSFVDELKDPKSIISDSYAAVAASLRFSTETGLPKALVMTSTRPGEGKSSSSLALAQNFARRGASVLLIDADLRKPAFKASSDKIGLTQLLTSDHEPVAKHVVPTQFDNLWLLPSGPIPPNPADLLSTGRMNTLLAETTAHFDFVIVDGPPVLGLADSLLLAAIVSNVLFVVESGKTRTRAALEALSMIRRTGANIVGAMLTKSADDLGVYGYKKYGYGTVTDKSTEILMIPHKNDR